MILSQPFELHFVLKLETYAMLYIMQKFFLGIVMLLFAFGFTRAQNTAVPNPKLQEIMAILPVPENPDRVTETDWNEFEARENMQFPQDFKDFINHHKSRASSLLGWIQDLPLQRPTRQEHILGMW
jgi:hypothetical protein